MHALADEHDTPLSQPARPLVAPPGSAVLWTAQLVPFQRSASVTATPKELMSGPTAVHALPELQDTPLNPGLNRVFVIDHREPSHRSARATCVVSGQLSASQKSVMLDDPTATHAPGAAHVTAFSVLAML